MNGTKTQKHKSILVMHIFRMIFFKLLDFLFVFTLFFTSLYARCHSDALAINLHVLLLTTLRLYPSLFITMIWHDISPIKGHYISQNITTK